MRNEGTGPNAYVNVAEVCQPQPHGNEIQPEVVQPLRPLRQPQPNVSTTGITQADQVAGFVPQRGANVPYVSTAGMECGDSAAHASEKLPLVRNNGQPQSARNTGMVLQQCVPQASIHRDSIPNNTQEGGGEGGIAVSGSGGGMLLTAQHVMNSGLGQASDVLPAVSRTVAAENVTKYMPASSSDAAAPTRDVELRVSPRQADTTRPNVGEGLASRDEQGKRPQQLKNVGSEEGVGRLQIVQNRLASAHAQAQRDNLQIPAPALPANTESGSANERARTTVQHGVPGRMEGSVGWGQRGGDLPEKLAERTPCEPGGGEALGSKEKSNALSTKAVAVGNVAFDQYGSFLKRKAADSDTVDRGRAEKCMNTGGASATAGGMEAAGSADAQRPSKTSAFVKPSKPRTMSLVSVQVAQSSSTEKGNVNGTNDAPGK